MVLDKLHQLTNLVRKDLISPSLSLVLMLILVTVVLIYLCD